MNIQTVSQRFRSVRCFVWEIDEKKCSTQIYKANCMERPCLCPSEGHKYGYRKLTKTCHLVLLQKAFSCILRAHRHLDEYLFSFKDCQDCKISGDKSLFLTYVTAFSGASLISCHAKFRNSTLVCHKTKNPIKLNICQKIGLQLF